MWNPLHSLVISGNIEAHISLLMKSLGLGKVEMSVKISLIKVQLPLLCGTITPKAMGISGESLAGAQFLRPMQAHIQF